MLGWAAWSGFFLQGIFFLDHHLDWQSIFKKKNSFQKSREAIFKTKTLLFEIKTKIESGHLPDDQLWKKVRTLHPPWGDLAGEALDCLRDSGAPVLPTLSRLLALLEEEDSALLRSRSRSAQAWAQSLSGISLVPVFLAAVYFFLPEVRASFLGFMILSFVALGWALMGAFWMLKLSENARWGGMKEEHRVWVLASFCAGERFLAHLRSGSPSDLAWEGVIRFLSKEAPGLALRWGSSLWSPGESSRGFSEEQAETRFARVGEEIKGVVQVSLFEGTPCAERAESLFQGLRRDWQFAIDRALELLPHRALLPLFLCTAPPLFLILAFSLWISFK